MTTAGATLMQYAATLPYAVAGAEGLRLRRFGSQAGDLAVDTRLPGPFAMTAVLAACAGDSADEASIWQLSVGSRIACLAALTGAETGGDFEFTVACPAPCNEPIETSITVEEVLDVASRAVQSPFACTCDGLDFVLRCPTGADQAGWLSAGYRDAATARRAILQTLISEGPGAELDEDTVALLEAALDEHDPILRCTVDVVCPFCGATSSHDLPLAESALGVLRAVQTRMTEAVHVLASRYGWSEGEILSLPRWRRDAYLSLIEQERR